MRMEEELLGVSPMQCPHVTYLLGVTVHGEQVLISRHEKDRQQTYVMLMLSIVIIDYWLNKVAVKAEGS